MIRPATAADEPFLLEMLELASNWRDGAPPNPVDLSYAAGFGRPGDVGVIEDGQGAAWCRLRTSDDPGYGYVADDIPELTIAVRGEHRGRGLAAALLSELMRAAARRGSARSASASSPTTRLSASTSGRASSIARPTPAARTRWSPSSPRTTKPALRAGFTKYRYGDSNPGFRRERAAS